MKNKHSMLLGSGDAKYRVNNDLYETPAFFTEELLKKETFNKDILEPACGNGRISLILAKNGYNVTSSDIVTRKYLCEEKDFLSSDFEVNKYDIVTNPPYSLMNEFIKKSSLIAKNKFAFVGRVQLLEGINRYNNFYKDGINDFRLSKIYLSVSRLNFISEKSFSHTSAMMSCWFVFEKGYKDLPICDWINYKR